jgi:hypothetical protein
MTGTEIAIAEAAPDVIISGALELRLAENPAITITDQRRSIEDQLRKTQTLLLNLTANLDKARWEALDLIVFAIRWTRARKVKRLAIGNSGDGIASENDEALIRFLFHGEKGPKVSQLVGIVRHALRENVPDVAEWIARNHGTDDLYRKVIAKPQTHPRGSHASAAQTTVRNVVTASRTNALPATEAPPRARAEPSEPLALPDMPAPVFGDLQTYEPDVERAHLYLLKLWRLAFNPAATEAESVSAFLKSKAFIGNHDIPGVCYWISHYSYIDEQRRGQSGTENR